MSFEVIVIGRAERTLHRTLIETIGEQAIRHDGNSLVLSIADQSQLVAVLERLTDLGVNVDHVRRAPPIDAAATAPGQRPGTKADLNEHRSERT